MKVAIVVPSGTTVHANFATSLAALVGSAATSGIHTALINPKSSIVATARNLGVRSALEQNPDYLLFLDSDMSFPSNALARLLSANKEIIGCNYIMRQYPHKSLTYPKGSEAQVASGILEVSRIPFGCVLLRACVFSILLQPWFSYPITENGELIGEDYAFCDKANKAGLSVWLDTALSLELVHWGEVGFCWKSGEAGGYYIVETIGR